MFRMLFATAVGGVLALVAADSALEALGSLGWWPFEPRRIGLLEPGWTAIGCGLDGCHVVVTSGWGLSEACVAAAPTAAIASLTAWGLGALCRVRAGTWLGAPGLALLAPVAIAPVGHLVWIATVVGAVSGSGIVVALARIADRPRRREARAAAAAAHVARRLRPRS